MSREENPEDSSAKPAGSDVVRRMRRIVVGVCVGFFVWYVLADRFTPYTASARVRAFVVPIVAEVSGYVEKVGVEDNQFVEANDVLLQIQKQRYQIAVDRAAASLQIASQSVGAGAEEINTAEAELAEARTNLEIFRIQAQRVISLKDTGAISMAYIDQARAEVVKKEAELAAAEANLERVKTELGLTGAANPQIRSAVADLEQGRLDLARTTIRAPSKGMISNLQIDEGYFASAGQSLMTFIAVDEIWIEAYMTENNLGRIERGDSARVSFDMVPGRVYQAEVVSLAGGAEGTGSGRVGGLPSVEAPRGWLRDPQRFPVRLRLTDPEYTDSEGDYKGGLKLRFGSQADVVIYTGDSWILNTLAALWIRLASIFSYAY